MEWIFDGIGSTIVAAILGLIIGGATGGFIGYKYAIKNKIHQSQKAKNNSIQKQAGNITIFNRDGDMNKGEKK